MKKIFIYIVLPVLITASCSSNLKKNGNQDLKPEALLQTVAAFKSAEPINENRCKLIFRKIDDCQYIVFYTDISTIKTFKENLVLSDGKSIITNHDFVNLRFKVNYTEETSPDQSVEQNAIINKLKSIERSPSDRFAAAGFIDDTKADDFILNLKKFVKTESPTEISNMISYPLNITNKKNKIRITNPEKFIKEYDAIFNRKVKDSIINQPLADIMASSKGLMIGTGEVWINIIDSKINITSIKNN